MKNYFSFIVAFSLVLSLVGANFLSYPQKVEAATSDCKYGQGYDSNTGTDCKLVPTCVYSNINHLTGLPCPVNATVNTNTFDLSIAKTLGVVKIREKNGRVVQAIQEALNSLGFKVGMDGKFGPQTNAAVRSVQAMLGLKADGVVGPKTFEALQRELNKKTNPVALLKKVQVAKNLDTGTGGSGGSSGSQNAVAVCGPNDLGAGPITLTATITADNWYQMYVGKKDGSALTLVGQDIGNSSTNTYANDHALAWASSQTHTFTVPADQRLFIVNHNDDWITNGAEAQFIYKDKSGKYTQDYTKPQNWEMMITEMDKLPKMTDVTTVMLSDEIKNGDWVATSSLGNNGVSPWGLISGITKLAQWLESAGVRRDAKKITIYSTKIDGAPGFESCVDTTCPVGTVGTPPNCNLPDSCPAGTTGTPPNCISTTCPAGTTGTPPNCNPVICPVGQIGTPPNCEEPTPIEIGTTKWCRGVWPAVHMKVFAKFNQPVTVVGIPGMKVKKDDGTFGAKLKYTGISADSMTLTFEYVAPLPDTDNYSNDDYIGKLVFDQPFIAGTSIKRKTTDAFIDLSGEWDAPMVASSPAQCPVPFIPGEEPSYDPLEVARTICLTKNVTSDPNTFEVTVGTDKNVFVSNTSGLKVTTGGTTVGAGESKISMPYVSGNWTNKLKFKYTKQSGDNVPNSEFNSSNRLQLSPQAGLIWTLAPSSTDPSGFKRFHSGVLLDYAFVLVGGVPELVDTFPVCTG